MNNDEWANAIESAEQVMLRWGHGQVRRLPDELVEQIVAALRAPLSEQGTPSAEAVKCANKIADEHEITGYSNETLICAAEILRLSRPAERKET